MSKTVYLRFHIINTARAIYTALRERGYRAAIDYPTCTVIVSPASD